MILNICDVVYYGRFYCDEVYEYETRWWLDRKDFKVYSTEELLSRFGFEDYHAIEVCYDLIPVFKTDIIALEKEFIKKYTGGGNIDEYDCLYDRKFKEYIDRKLLIQEWYEFERRKLIEDAILWCQFYKIPYVVCEK